MVVNGLAFRDFPDFVSMLQKWSWCLDIIFSFYNLVKVFIFVYHFSSRNVIFLFGRVRVYGVNHQPELLRGISFF